MHTPTAAFAWELWRRNSKRLMGIIGLVVGFALLYPKLCALAAFNPDNPDALDEFARKLVVVMKGGPTPIWIFQILYLVFLAAGPAAAMFLSLLGLLWMFTFIEFNPNKRDPTTFPGRIFTLPVSTSFLFFWLLLTGLAAIALLYGSWNYFVRLPHLNIFGAYDKCFGWMTLLALAQGIVWALAGWPVMRFLLLAVVFSSFLGNPTWLAALAICSASVVSNRRCARSCRTPKDADRPMAGLDVESPAPSDTRPRAITRTKAICLPASSPVVV